MLENMRILCIHGIRAPAAPGIDSGSHLCVPEAPEVPKPEPVALRPRSSPSPTLHALRYSSASENGP